MKLDERKKIKAEAKSKAAEVLAQENSDKMQAKVEELFSEMSFELEQAKADKDKTLEDNTKLSEDLENLKSDKEELAKQKAEFEQKAEELQQKLTEADEKIKALEGEIDSMKQEAALQARVAELEEAGLLSAGNLAEKQKTRIKAMDDEEFAEHKAYLTELREGIAQKLEAEKKEKESDSKDKKDKKLEDDETDSKDKSKTKSKKKDKEEEADDDEDFDATAALAELANLEIDENNVTPSELLKIKKQALRALDVASVNAAAAMIEQEDRYVGVPDGLLAEYDGMWEEDEE